MRSWPFITMLLPGLLAAQSVRTSASLDSAIIRIGEQVQLTLQVEYPQGEAGGEIGWPIFETELAPHVEVVHASQRDTLIVDDGGGASFVRIVQRLSITSFDTGYWAIPPFRFMVGGQAVETAALLVEVRGVQLDPAIAMHGIKPIHELPFSLLFWMRNNALILAGGALLALLIAGLVHRLRKRPTHTVIASAVKEVLPLHERVRRDLLALEGERLWQQGQHKGYQSRLTDLLRGYIEERYQVPAMERTTDELLHELRVSPLSNDQRQQLANMLHLADMVKFAKAVPTPHENEHMMAAALRFVHDTADRRTPIAPETTMSTTHA